MLGSAFAFIFKIIIQVFCAGIIGQFIADHYQSRKKFLLIKQKKVEKDAQSILDISKKITESAIARRDAAVVLVESLSKSLFFLNSNNMTEFNKESKKQKELRDNYRKEVKKWNKELTIINIDLYNIGLSSTAIYELEGICDYNMNLNEYYTSCGLHADFFKVHLFINEYINSKNKNQKILDYISEILKIIDNEIRNLSRKLILISNEKWNLLSYNFTEPFSKDNYKRASTWELFIALFYQKPSFLRIKNPKL